MIPTGQRCLDIGADNGVISLLLRRRGGRWASADLDEHTVASIRELVGDDVHQLDGARTPFPDQAFDQVVVVDYLEHIPDDERFADELARILKPGGRVIVNVPHLKPRLAAEPLPPRDRSHRRMARTSAPGLQSRGHPRRCSAPGSSSSGRSPTPRRFPSWWTPASTASTSPCSGGRATPRGSSKGTVVTQADMRKHRKQFLLLSGLYPFLWAISGSTRCCSCSPGYKLIVRARLAA